MTEIGYSERLDIFSRNVEDMGILNKQWVEIGPCNALTQDSPLEFNLPGNSLRYIDLSNTFINIKMQVLKGDGTDLTEEAQVAPVNLSLQSLWRQVDISLGQVPLSGVGVNYAWKALIDTLLETNSTSKHTQLQGQLFKKDTAGNMEDASFGDNYGFNWRNAKIAKSIVCEMEGPIFVDFAQQDKFLLNSVPINLKFWHSNNRFRLMSDDENADYKIKIKDALLKVCYITVNPQIIVAHDEALKSSSAVYPYMRSEIRTFSVPGGNFNFRMDNLFNNDVPLSVVVGLIAGEAYNGSYTLNPYNFQNFDLDFACFYVENNPTPAKGFTPVYLSGSQGNFTTPYLAMFGESRDENFGNDITLDDFSQGYALYKFNISNAEQIKKKGATRLELSFKKALPTVVTVVVYAKFPAIIRIDETRKVWL